LVKSVIKLVYSATKPVYLPENRSENAKWERFMITFFTNRYFQKHQEL